MVTEKKSKLGIIIGDRGFFPRHLIKSGRESILKILSREGIDALILNVEDTASGGVESLGDARKCGELFKQHAGELDGILVSLPNFGDEKAVANSIRFSGLKLPVLVHAFHDTPDKMTGENRRDAFCGKISVCNNLRQYGVPFTLTKNHTTDPDSDDFKEDLHRFIATCRVVNGLKGLRIGAVGARPAAFNTVRYSEKMLEHYGISVEPLDLSEIIGMIDTISDNDPQVTEKVREIEDYAVTRNVPALALVKMAKLRIVIEKWMNENGLQILTIQCWTAMEQYFGITPCTVMSMLSDQLIASACETDVVGAISMYALSLASQQAGMLLDWNNNYGEDLEKAVVFHCGNLPSQVLEGRPEIKYSEIFADSVGAENAYGTIAGRIKEGPFTFCRVSTDDLNGTMRAYIGEGRFTSDPMKTFGCYGVAEIPGLQDLMKIICNNGFEHHVAATLSRVGSSVYEALDKYLGWDVYSHYIGPLARGL
ncbi:MAG: L-fucose/L-arabinose isomerase family protein [Deltaproteobacteria bacterium]|nr:L-fucose/L-arabinose isomerase family protein [Deltaproteobacteria bacterium]